MNICTGNAANAHIDFSYVGKTTSYNGQIGYDNSTNNMIFKTNKVYGMALDSMGRLALGSTTPIPTSVTLYVSGNSYISGDDYVNGTITTNKNVLLASSTSKVVVGAAIAESCIQALNLKATTPTSMGIHLGMDSTAGAAGIEIVAASTTQKRLHRFYISRCCL